MNELVKKSTEGIKDKLYSCIESTFDKIESLKHDLSCIYEGVANDLDILNANEEQIPYSEAYNKGLEDGRKDVWELARKLFSMEGGKFDDVFGEVFREDTFNYYTPQEALAKLEAYEKEQEEIKVGDVCKFGQSTMVVTKAGHTQCHGFFIKNPNGENGKVGTFATEHLKKTGKHIDISSILEQIGGV